MQGNLSYYVRIVCIGLWLLSPMCVYGNNPEEKILIVAENFHYDQKLQLISAVGHVEVHHEGRIVIADRLTYDQMSDHLEAVGNVSVLEVNGSVFFADHVTLKQGIKHGIIENFRARFSDNSLLAANKAIQVNEDITQFEQAVYSPCKVCIGEPLWQIKSDKVIIDQKKEKVSYNNARFEVKGMPIFYLPYFRHASPDAKRESGFLSPSYSRISTLGATVKLPYYLNIASNMDATITPFFTSDEGLVMEGEFRHLLKNGAYELRGSITRPDQVNSLGQTIAGKKEVRGFYEGQGQFKISDHWHWGFAGKRTSDDTFLKRYKYGYEDILTSRVYAEHFKSRDYTGIQALSFQGLNITDDLQSSPHILPYTDIHIERPALYKGSFWTLDGNILGLFRDDGSESKRVSLTGGWRLPLTTKGGHRFEIATQLRTDTYYIDEAVSMATSEAMEKEFVSRIIPQLSVEWGLPMVREGKKSRTIIEPILQVIVSPDGGNPSDIPNEDSQVLEFSDENIFSKNRFTGLDRVETGQRMSYGIRGSVLTDKADQFKFLLGQSARLEASNEFTKKSGLSKHFSDLAGRVEFIAHKHIEIGYRFRLDQDDFSNKRSELQTGLRFNRMQFQVNYVFLDEEEELDKQQVSAFSHLLLSDQWSLSADVHRNVEGERFISSGAALQYEGDCVNLLTSWRREFTRDRDIEPATIIRLQVGLKNLN